MELIEYLRYLYKYWLWLLAGIVLGAIVAGLIASTQKDAYQATISLFVQRQPDTTTNQYYTYDGYYGQQTAAAYTDNAIKLLTNDEIVSRAAKNANLPTDAVSLAKLKGAITAKKDASQLITLTVISPTSQEATEFTQGLADSLRQRTSELNQDGDKRLTVDQVNVTPYVVLTRPWVLLYAIAGAILGFLLLAAACAGWEYVRLKR